MLRSDGPLTPRSVVPPIPPQMQHYPLEVAQPPVPQEQRVKTNVRYDVVGKTIGQLRADMESGVTTSVEITQAYLDRIRAYDQGQFGFNAFEVVAQDALQQARATDNARFQERRGRCWGFQSRSRISTTPSTCPLRTAA